MNTKLLKSAAMALVLSAGLANFARAADTPNQGGTIVVTYKDDMATLDPAIGYDWQNWSMINSLFSRLVDYKFGTTEIVPSLADSWTISPDGLVYTFKLNPKAKFTNGRKVTAADIKYSIERSVNPKTQGPAGGFFHSIVGQDKMADGSATTISGIETPDDSTIKFTLTQPDATFLNVLALNFASAVPKEVVEAEGADFGKKPVGSGAFKLDEWVPGQRLVFSRNADYFRDRPNLDGFKVEIGQEPLVAILRLQKGEVDIAGDGIPPAKYLEIKNSPDAQGLDRRPGAVRDELHHDQHDQEADGRCARPQGDQHGDQQGSHRAHHQRPRDAGEPSAAAADAGLRQGLQGLSLRRRRREEAHGGGRPQGWFRNDALRNEHRSKSAYRPGDPAGPRGDRHQGGDQGARAARGHRGRRQQGSGRSDMVGRHGLDRRLPRPIRLLRTDSWLRRRDRRRMELVVVLRQELRGSRDQGGRDVEA